MDGALVSQYTHQLTIFKPDGSQVVLEMESWSGGTLSPANTKKRQIGGEETARGGKKSRGDLTLARECDPATWALKPTLEDSSGIDPCTAIRNMVDARGNVIGDPEPVNGILGDITWPDSDLASDDVGLVQVVVQASV